MNDKEKEDGMRVKCWAVYHDIEILEEMGFAPIGYPPLNPEDVSNDYSGLSNAYNYNKDITMMRFGPRDSVLTARPCNSDLTIKVGGEEHILPRAYLYCPKGVDGCIEEWMDENLGRGEE